MNNRVICASVVALVLVAGCPQTGQSSPQFKFLGNLSSTDDGFQMNGKIQNSEIGDPPKFENVTFYLYSEQKELIYSKAVGSVRRQKNVSITHDQVPEYVIINSPDFWERDSISVNYYELSDSEGGMYSPRAVSSREAFPVQLPD